MKKLDVAETLRFAYRFAFGQLGTIIGLIWAPMVVIAVLRFLPFGLGDANLSPQTDPAAAGVAALRGLVFGIASLLLYAVIHVAVIRQALGLRTGSAVFHFALGAAELRLAAATLLIGIVLAVLILACALLVLGTAAVVGRAVGTEAGNAVGIVGAIVALSALLVPFVRLAFLYIPVTVAEERISFERCWVLTAGNFWRAGTVMFLASLPVLAVVFAAYYALMARDFSTLTPLIGKLSPEALSLRLDAISERHIATIIGINLIVTPFYLGLTLGAAAHAYRALSGRATADA